ncbi:MAG: hypothetical protein AVDCRST_MAG56-7089 [uncultured Cytophagales bacterium]|uniref:DUF4468 domain-containing protein n=1 Tax=uncultured Cytophagales bacterium TaxID=158755 RepID=A0A6J4L8T9_9SPHI|nr:MAG: hypothetical protein AVDCRST_MAG56-7089 [uncultured Cytophagales bacterium]
MRFPAACCLLIFAVLFPARAQTRVVVSDVRQVVRLAPAWRSVLGEESFPDYFGRDSVRTGQVLDRVSGLLAQKWPGARVTFAEGNRIRFIRSGQPALPPPQLPARREEGDIFVAIVQGLNPTTTATDDAGMPVTYFVNVCSVRAEDASGKPVWESRVTMPFGTAVPPASTYGLAEMSAADWQKLFLTSLEAALQHKSRRLPPTTFYRPPFSHAALPKHAQPVVLREGVRDGLLYRKGEARKITFSVGEGADAATYGLDQQFVGNPEMTTGVALTKGTLTNKATDQVYELVAEFALPEDHAATSEERRRQSISVRCTAGGLLAGRFTLTANGLEGQWGYGVYNIRRIAPKNTFEVRYNDQLVAVAQKGGLSGPAGARTRNTYLLTGDVEEGTAAELHLVWLVYQTAYQFGQDFLGY